MGATSTHFSNSELACHHCGINSCVQMLVDGLEALRALACIKAGRDTPIIVDDAFRCLLWNAATPNAATHSQHTEGTAADIKIEGWTAWELFELAIQVPAFWNGGIGRADLQGYLHVDCRGTTARWCYSASGAVIPWFVPGAVQAMGWMG